MGLVSMGFDQEGVERFTVLRLTRKEAALYVGLTESGIRDAEGRGLPHRLDPQGHSWLAPIDLDAWTWRAPLPSLAKRRSVLAAAEKARCHEARVRAQTEEKRLAALEREEAEETERQLARLDAEDRLRDETRARNEAARVHFNQAHVDERAAGLALGLDAGERRRHLRELKAAGLLREIEPPCELVVVAEFDAMPRIELSSYPLVRGGPFYVREDVLRLRAEQLARHPHAETALTHGRRDDGSVFWQLFAEFIRGASGR